MDAITILGTAGAVVNIIDIIGRSIKTLRDLHDRWEDADLIALNLITQLGALKAALSQISEWVSSDLAYHPHHYQLVMDLGSQLDVASCWLSLWMTSLRSSSVGQIVGSIQKVGCELCSRTKSARIFKCTFKDKQTLLRCY